MVYFKLKVRDDKTDLKARDAKLLMVTVWVCLVQKNNFKKEQGHME